MYHAFVFPFLSFPFFFFFLSLSGLTIFLIFDIFGSSYPYLLLFPLFFFFIVHLFGHRSKDRAWDGDNCFDMCVRVCVCVCVFYKRKREKTEADFQQKRSG
jgi:hypothetical protein